MNVARLFSDNEFTRSISMKKASQDRFSIILRIRQVFQLQAEIYLLINELLRMWRFVGTLSYRTFLFKKKGLARTVFIKYVADLLGRNRQL